jgi:hypothetical protein
MPTIAIVWQIVLVLWIILGAGVAIGLLAWLIPR